MAGKETNLIVNITVNPPQIAIIGPIKETTIQKLNARLPQITTTAPGHNTRCAFECRDEPKHWYTELRTSFANEELGQSFLMLVLLDALAEENWRLKGTNATNHDHDKVTYKFFLVNKMA